MATGIVTSWDGHEGTGVIRPDGGGPDHFVHYGGIDHIGYVELKPGQRVEFESTTEHQRWPTPPGWTGPQAIKVRQLPG